MSIMNITRRSALSLMGASAFVPALARAGDIPSTETARTLGSPKAPVTVVEFFSMTCTHCAEFTTYTMPQIKTKLVDTGKVRFVYHDFPLDQVALKAAQVARYMPLAEYYPFIGALFASQYDWAFQNGENYQDRIYKYAALAGMDRGTYDEAWNDEALGKWILAGQQQDEKIYGVDATPTFIINGMKHAGALEYSDFEALVVKAGG